MPSLIEHIAAKHGQNAADMGVKQGFAEDMRAEPKLDGTMLVTAVANTAAIDLADEVVVPEGCILGANNQPVYLSDARAIFLNHNYNSAPIGAFRSARMTQGRWLIQMALNAATDLARDVQALFRLGDDNPMRGTSIGFLREQAGQPTKEEIATYGPAGYITRTWKWMEHSITPQPCNPEAWVVDAAMKSAPTLDDRTMDALDTFTRKGIIRRETAGIIGLPDAERRVVAVATPKAVRTTNLLIVRKARA